MYFKLAIKNVRKSFKDYSVYFLTLTLAVCIFYSFNSIESQNALIELKSSNSQSISNLVKIISVISVFVSIILGSLILYASNFLIKKRKKELGIYMILGMGKRKISKILLTETLIVGILSLASGLVLGFGVSQGLSMFTLKLFDLSSNDYQFSISVFAIFKTIVYFAVMFLLVMFFNVGIVSKYKVEELLNRYNFNITRDEEYISYDIYETDLIIKDFLENQENIFNNRKIDFIKKSDYNKIMRFKKEEVVEMKSDEILILSSNNQLIRAIEQRINENNQVVFKEKSYTVKNDEVISKNLENDFIFTNFLTVVIEDSFLDNHKITKSVLNVNYLSENREELNKKYNELQRNVFENTDKEKDFLNIVGITKDGEYQNSKGLTTIILFVGMYIGIIFLITSMAVLAIQQLSEASDSIDRYTALRKIGASEKMIEKTIFIQTFIYFTLPIVLAFSHSIVGIKVVDSFLSAFQESDIQFSALSTAAIFLVVYGGYFYLTFTGYKNVVQNRDFSG
ncbi:ABC-type antimicrobial peptide transport system permease subunit [Acetoanaerobium pronyense]|uniref:ABC-type antimicrobial peptide transport system permease subunit n=1 Tax=Acetoanaerobium pronyense TaxID=1482736 RepID=A0ABS4KLJ5_9FIRM|nr:ABC transporter permease [Acetoanaerobium pronyense]MBP2028643.1 ABC-type antimicrobial peptide transport system permease subunit [Acetoanaerobium pronyense]